MDLRGGDTCVSREWQPRDEELAELRRENKNLREERDILRKAVAIKLTTPEMKYRFIAEQQSAHSLRKMARVLEVSRRGYHAWLGRSAS